MKGIWFCILALALLISACGPLDYSTPSIPQPVTQIPFFASDTPPPFIVPITETPTPTLIPDIPLPATDTPLPDFSVPNWYEVYFTDPQTQSDPNVIAGSIEEKLIQQINNAQISIHIASFEFNLTPVAQALIDAKNRGVDVKWVTDDENGLEYDVKPDRGQFAMLQAAGIEVKDDVGRSALMHNKFWIFDGQIAWTGSTNITVNGIFKQNNNVLVMWSPEISQIYEREFQEMWNGQFGPRAPSTVNNQWAIMPDGTPIQVLFSPEDDVVNKIVALMNDAQFSIRFLAFSFTDFPMAQTMINKANAGLDVAGVFETFGSSSPSSELKTFYCAKVPVRQDGNSSFLHDKIIIIDGSIVVTGSLNFSSNADESNEENVIILDNPGIASMYLQEFDKLWGQSNAVDGSVFAC